MVAQKKILIVDDDGALRESLCEQLLMHGEFAVSEAETGQTALAVVHESHFDLVLLDVGLPDSDGGDVFILMRQRGIKAPIIMLTADESESETVLGLDPGPDDYVTKPFRFGVLLSCIRTQLRRYEATEGAVLCIGSYRFEPVSKLLIQPENNRRVRLTEKETEILKYLYQARDQAVPRGVLLDELWGYNTKVTTHTLETHIYRLRQKIESDPSNAELLITEDGGYRLVS